MLFGGVALRELVLAAEFPDFDEVHHEVEVSS